MRHVNRHERLGEWRAAELLATKGDNEPLGQ